MNALSFAFPDVSVCRPEDEEPFLKAATELFWDGRFLGTDELTAPATITDNRLAVGVRNYFYNTCRFSKVWVCLVDGKTAASPNARRRKP